MDQCQIHHLPPTPLPDDINIWISSRWIIAEVMNHFFLPHPPPDQTSSSQFNPNPRKMRHLYLGLFFPMKRIPEWIGMSPEVQLRAEQGSYNPLAPHPNYHTRLS